MATHLLTAEQLASVPESLTLAHRSTIDEGLWSRLVARIVRDEPGMTVMFAERILDQALGYLTLAAARPGNGFAPSPLVDIGWHTFILYTRDYAAHCARLTNGGFIHHQPTDDPEQEFTGKSPRETAEAMRELGLSVDTPLWTCFGDDSGCKNCNDSQGCKCGTCNY